MKYNKLKGFSSSVYKEKGSKFIAFAAPCSSEEEAQNLLHKWKKEHPQARHLCYAYKIGFKDKERYRANDDGEPTNSAGLPILRQIESFGLSNVLIGVIRYFGGVKLGVGGLISAYKTAAKEAILNGEIIEKEIEYHYEIGFDYSKLSDIMNFLKRNKINIVRKNFKESCVLKINLTESNKDEIIKTLKQLGQINIIEKGLF